jgi:hypothetical protein
MGYVLHWYFQTEKIVISKIYNIERKEFIKSLNNLYRR